MLKIANARFKDMDIDGEPYRVVLHFFDDIRVIFNRNLEHLESWQIISYTISAILFIQWVRKVVKLDDSSIRRQWHQLLLNVSFYRVRFNEQREATLKDLEEKSVEIFEFLRFSSAIRHV